MRGMYGNEIQSLRVIYNECNREDLDVIKEVKTEKEKEGEEEEETEQTEKSDDWTAKLKEFYKVHR